MLASLDSLVVPATFARYDKAVDTTVSVDPCAWKLKTELSLNQLDLSDVTALSVLELADLVRVLAPLTAVAQWSSPAIRSLASACLARIPASGQLIAHILTQTVKPLFAPTPHPRLHTSTARILPRPADVQDTYIEQPWKDHPGLDEVIRWCLLNTESSAYESAWPLFLPPVMTFLDDYQVPYKFLGVRLISDMLTRAPPDLLLRTGVDELMHTSLMHSLSHLGDQSTPGFIRLAVKVSLKLIDLTTPSAFPSLSVSPNISESLGTPTMALTQTLSPTQSKSLSTRFFRLSTLLSSSLLGTVILYTPTYLLPTSSSDPRPDPFSDPEHANTDSIHVSEPLSAPVSRTQSFNPTLVAVAQSLPSVLLALGIGGARFLKGVIPVLSEWLALPLHVVAETIDDNEGVSQCDGGGPLHHDSRAFTVDVTLHCASLSSLSVLFQTCAPRIGGWSTTIVNALGRCWVGCVDIESHWDNIVPKDGLCILKKLLRDTAAQLAGVYPPVVKV